MRALIYALFCAVMSSSIVAYAEQDPWQLLQKAAFAARQLNYKGVFVYQNGQHMRSVQITHMNNNGHELARNVILDGEPREVFSQDDELVIFHPKRDKVVIEKRHGQNLFPAMLPADLSAVKRNYRVKLGDIERIAGREAQIINLVPNDRLRYFYRIWADTEYGLLLKMMLLNNQQQALEQIGFTQLDMINSHDLDWFQPKMEQDKHYVMQDKKEIAHVTNDWVIADLPPGYRKIDHILVSVPGKKTPIDQLIISDGIASVSLFIEPILQGMRPKQGHQALGSTNMSANVVDGYQVMVVGEVPSETVKRISKAVSFKMPAQ